MSPTPLGRFVTWALLLATVCLSVQTRGPTHQWLHRKETIKHFPLNIQQTMLNNTLKQKNMELTGNVPEQIQGEIPVIIEYLVNGAIDVFLSNTPVVGPLLGPIVKGGISRLKALFGGGKVYIPNLPPLIVCPDDIETTQDKGRLTAVVTWQEPTGYDAEDVVLRNVRRTGKAPGSRFHGESIIRYNVADSQGRTDFCYFAIKVDIIKCRQFPVDNTLINSCFGKNIYYRDVCNFSCPAGYTLKGRSALTCNVERQFDGRFPTCEHTGCSQPKLPIGGSAWDCSNTYNLSSVCRLKCEPGYQTARTKDGSEGYIQCAGDRSWTGSAECIGDDGAIMGAINELKQKLNIIETILTGLVDQLTRKTSPNGTH